MTPDEAVELIRKDTSLKHNDTCLVEGCDRENMCYGCGMCSEHHDEQPDVEVMFI